jgi:hypothetical protein
VLLPIFVVMYVSLSLLPFLPFSLSLLRTRSLRSRPFFYPRARAPPGSCKACSATS